MARNKWLDRLMPKSKKSSSYIRDIVSGSLYRISDIRGDTSFADIKTEIDTMRALARDSQISTALSYYATDATTPNSNGDIIWATPIDSSHKNVAEIINVLFKRWNINMYARDHILELATIGNLYIPTTDLYKQSSNQFASERIALDNNTIEAPEFDIIPSTKLDPQEVIHMWREGKPYGYIYQPEESGNMKYTFYPEQSIIHFSLGGLLGDYEIDATDANGNIIKYDIQFAQPLMEKAVQPTQTLSLLEDSLLLSSLNRVIRFIGVDCGNSTEEDEIRDILQQMKDAIEQQLSINTSTGDVQSFVNPQSPNNLIYVPKVNGNDPISITDLNMTDSNSEDSKLLQHFQDKKLSVLGVPKEAMNFSSNEGLGGAGAVLSQRSALYANSLQRLETAYIAGWTDALNKYFLARNMSGCVDNYKLNMQPIITNMSTVVSERRDGAINQALQLVQMLKDLGVKDTESYINAITEALKEVFPGIGSNTMTWDIDISKGGESNEF